MTTDTLNLISIAQTVLSEESQAILHLADILDDQFKSAVEAIFRCQGKLIVSGMGKSGHIARKIASTLTSTGTPSVYLNPAEALHGDLGLIESRDVVMLISKSGENPEINVLFPQIKRLDVTIISISNHLNCTLAKLSDINLILDVVKEACPNDLAPTTSSTVTLALGDALAVALMKMRNFGAMDFAKFHPGGNLGKQLLQVKDAMEKKNLPFIKAESSFHEILKTFISSLNRGVAIVVSPAEELLGIIVEGDLKRLLLHDNVYEEIKHLTAEKMMNTSPKTISPDALIAEALKLMEGKITSLIVTEQKKVVGLLHIHDILSSKFI